MSTTRTAAGRRPLHRAVHPECPFGATSWDACDKAAKEARGRCTALTEAETECSNWAVAEYDGRPYCGQHYGSRVNADLEAKRRSLRKAEIDERIERYLAWTALHPSILDTMPDGWQPSAATQAPVSPRRLRPGVVWSAVSGVPFSRRG